MYMNKIKLYIGYLVSNRPIVYISMFIITGYMITTMVNNYIEKKQKEAEQIKITIEKNDKIKQKFIDSETISLKTIQDKEKEIKFEITNLNKILELKKNNLLYTQNKITIKQTCINGVKETIGTLNRYDCTKQVGFIKKAQAEEVKKTLKPSELFYTTKESDKCHISQNEQSHFTKAGGYMLATDVACDFNKDGKGDQFEVYAPDYLNQAVTYTISKKHDNLLGDYIELLFNEYNDNPENIIKQPRDKKWIIGHTTTNLKDGDIVTTGQKIGQSNLSGYTTGYHSHIELWTIIDGKRKNISYTTRSDVINNKRLGLLDKSVKQIDPIYFTSYNLGDVNQNDSTPYIGASGKDLRYIKNPIALTKDIRQLYGIKFGDKVKLDGPCSGEYEVHDEMNIRFRTSCISKQGACIKGDIAIPKNSKDLNCSGVYKISKV